MIKVSLIGTGNVATHLIKVFSNTKEVQVVEVLSSRENLEDKITNPGAKKEIPNIYIIAVSDDAICTVSEQLKGTNKLVVHTSGSVPITTLPSSIRKGVFYPLQSFSKERTVDFKGIPICIEADNTNDLHVLKNLGKAISNFVYEIDSEQRKSLHLAAVFINNFSNHLYHIAAEICEQQKVSFDILKPLILETAKKVNTITPLDAQTGPARRNDTQTITHQINQLQSKNYQEIYKILTASIQNTYEKKL